MENAVVSIVDPRPPFISKPSEDEGNSAIGPNIKRIFSDAHVCL